MASRPNTLVYVKKTKPKIGRHKKRLNKAEKRNYKKYRGQGRP